MEDTKKLISTEELSKLIGSERWKKVDVKDDGTFDINQYIELGYGQDHTLLYLCAQDNNIEAVRELLKFPSILPNKGFRVDYSNAFSSPLYISCKKNRLEIVKLLLNHPKIKVHRGCGSPFYNFGPIEESPLIVACHFGNIEIVKEFLKHPDLDPNIGCFCGFSEEYKKSPLYHCIERKQLLCFQELLKNEKVDITKGYVFEMGPFPNRDKHVRDSLLHCAVKLSDSFFGTMFSMNLLKKGFDKDVLDIDGKKAHEIATSIGLKKKIFEFVLEK